MKIKHRLVLLSLALVLAASSPAQIILAAWTFETTTPADLNNATTYPGFNADLGAGLASGFHASNATDWSTPGGNGSANGFATNTWSVGDYFQFQVSTHGFQGIAVSWAQVSSTTGPGQFKLSYSTDGLAFVDFGPLYAVLANSGANTWSNSTPIATTTYFRDLSAIGALANTAAIYFRLTDATGLSATGGTVSASGATRIDDFSVTGFAIPPSPTPTPVPESAAWSWIAVAALTALAVARHHAARPKPRPSPRL
jgi:hypothetical protein